MNAKATFLRTSLVVAELYLAGKSVEDIGVQLGMEVGKINELLKLAQEHVELSYSLPRHQTLEVQLMHRYGLSDAVVIDSFDPSREVESVGKAAAQFFVEHVSHNDSIGLSCGETLLTMIEQIPRRPRTRLSIFQMTIESHPELIEQAPSTLLGMLKAKSSSDSIGVGLQLPPPDIVKKYPGLRKDILESSLFTDIQTGARNADFLFLGVGTPLPLQENNVNSFTKMARSTFQNFDDYKKLISENRIVGEINNHLFDREGNDLTASVLGASSSFISVLSLTDLKEMSAKPEKHTVCAVAAGKQKVGALHSCLLSNLTNSIITTSETATKMCAIPLAKPHEGRVRSSRVMV